MGWATWWAIFSQTYLVTLVETIEAFEFSCLLERQRFGTWQICEIFTFVNSYFCKWVKKQYAHRLS
jgi:hypothetical protein